jgi:hypothetical protein
MTRAWKTGLAVCGGWGLDWADEPKVHRDRSTEGGTGVQTAVPDRSQATQYLAEVLRSEIAHLGWGPEPCRTPNLGQVFYDVREIGRFTHWMSDQYQGEDCRVLAHLAR